MAGVLKTETTDYTLDKESGTLVMTVAPGSNVETTSDHSAVRVTDTGWLQITNDTILSLGDDFWTEFTDTSNFTSTANMLSLSLVASRPNCIAVYDFLYRESTSEDWRPVNALCNWRYDRANNVIYLGKRDAFTTAGILFKIRGLETYTLGTAITDTLPVQDRFLTVLEYGCLERYYHWREKEVVQLLSKQSQETTRTPLQEILMLSDRYHRLYLEEKAKLKPMKPAYRIPNFNPAGGNP